MWKNCECKGTFIIIIKWLFVLGHLEYSCLYACKWAQGLKYLLTFRTYVQQNMHKSATAEQAMSSEISSFIHNFPLKTHHLSGILPQRFVKLWRIKEGSENERLDTQVFVSKTNICRGIMALLGILSIMSTPPRATERFFRL